MSGPRGHEASGERVRLAFEDAAKETEAGASLFTVGYKLGVAHQELRHHVERYGSTEFLRDIEARIHTLMELHS